MPESPKRPCNHPGCPELVSSGYCLEHAKARLQRNDKGRGSANQRGYNYRWQQYSQRFLLRNKWCVCEECQQTKADGGVREVAEVVDHIVPHRGDYKLFWDPSNHQPLNKRHHDKKTAREDGGFGR